MNYHWYKEGEALLQEIDHTNLASDALVIWYIGQMGIIVKAGGLTVCMDPVLNDLCDSEGISRRNYMPPFDGTQLKGIDYVFCSHNHADHINLETLLPLHQVNPAAKFIVPDPEVHVLIDGGISEKVVIGAKEKETIKLTEKVQVCPIAAAHETYVTDEQGNQRNLGYVLDFD